MKKGLKIFIVAVALPLMCLLVHRWMFALASSEDEAMVIGTTDRCSRSLPLEDEREYTDMRMMCPACTASVSSFSSKWSNGTASECLTNPAMHYGQMHVHHTLSLPNYATGRNLVNLLHRLLI